MISHTLVSSTPSNSVTTATALLMLVAASTIPASSAPIPPTVAGKNALKKAARRFIKHKGQSIPNPHFDPAAYAERKQRRKQRLKNKCSTAKLFDKLSKQSILKSNPKTKAKPAPHKDKCSVNDKQAKRSDSEIQLRTQCPAVEESAQAKQLRETLEQDYHVVTNKPLENPRVYGIGLTHDTDFNEGHFGLVRETIANISTPGDVVLHEGIDKASQFSCDYFSLFATKANTQLITKAASLQCQGWEESEKHKAAISLHNSTLESLKKTSKKLEEVSQLVESIKSKQKELAEAGERLAVTSKDFDELKKEATDAEAIFHNIPQKFFTSLRNFDFFAVISLVRDIYDLSGKVSEIKKGAHNISVEANELKKKNIKLTKQFNKAIKKKDKLSNRVAILTKKLARWDDVMITERNKVVVPLLRRPTTTFFVGGSAHLFPNRSAPYQSVKKDDPQHELREALDRQDAVLLLPIRPSK